MLRLRTLVLTLALAGLVAGPSQAFSRSQWKTSGTVAAYAMPVIAGSVAIYKRDWKGLAQLTVVTGLTYAAAYGLKQIVKSCRPYAKPCTPGGSGWDSFPSTTTALASAPSSFMWQRYGWEWGLPMFIISKYPSYALQKAKQNKIWDGLATTALAWGMNEIFTTKYHKPYERGVYTNFDSDGRGLFATVGYRW